MIARSEDEFEQFQKIDEIRRKESDRARLMAEDELPEWMLKEEESVGGLLALCLSISSLHPSLLASSHMVVAYLFLTSS